MVTKIYFDVTDTNRFTDLPTSLNYSADSCEHHFTDLVNTFKSCNDPHVIIFNAFEHNITDVEAMLKILKDNKINFTVACKLSSPITIEKINLVKQCTIDNAKKSIYCIFDYPKLYHADEFNNWNNRLVQLIQHNISPIPLVILNKQTISCVRPQSMMNFFANMHIKIIDFLFVNRQSNPTEVPDNDNLIDWLTELYKYYKSYNKGKITFDKFVIRAFKMLKAAKNHQLENLTTTRVITSRFGGVVSVAMNNCTRCPDCPFRDFYRNRDNVPKFTGEKCFRDIFQ